jgi:creatinine amidohydrolase/Fe(II)-dependent formamide hydrolase-like protein
VPAEFATLGRDKLLALPRHQTVFFFAVGPLEDHGEHLPLDLDLREAGWLCRASAERLERELPGWTGVAMPALALGVDSDTTELAVRVRPHVLRDWLVDACRSLSRLGFVHFVCFSGHLGPRQLTAIEEAGQMIALRGMFGLGQLRSLLAAAGLSKARRPCLVSASSALVPGAVVRASPFWPDPKEHGGKRDFSVALRILPRESLPDEKALRALKPSNQDREQEGFIGRALLRSRHELKGSWGHPEEATPEEGERLLQGALDTVFPKLRAVWGGASANALFRSWYSVIPPNRSFFKSWVLAILILLIFGAWIWVWMQR